LNQTPAIESEFNRIRAIQHELGLSSSRVKLGIGDDAAICEPPKENLLLCSDAMVEGIHFDFKYTSFEDLGFKALAACLSDIAAMNGEPLYAVISLALPRSISKKNIQEFYQGAKAIALQTKTDIVGGDLTASKTGFFVDVALVGNAKSPSTRSGAKPGDFLAVSGLPGASRAGLFALQNFPLSSCSRSLLQAHLRPQPRFDLLPALRASQACTSLIDVSDGLSSEIHHLAESSQVGFLLEEALVPLHPDARKLSADAFEWALSGGEDYELLATFDQMKVEQEGIPNGFKIIGRALEPNQGIQMQRIDGTRSPLVATGFDHFASS
jgi:thiamine-monophosphate kinase